MRFLLLCLLIPSVDPETPREQFLGVTYSQVGVREATGHNDGIQVEAYLKACNLKKGPPYCAAFCYWGTKQVKHQPQGKPSDYAYSPNWFPKAHLTVSPKPGDMIGIWFQEKGRIAHMGIYVGQVGGFVYTLEANTNPGGSRDGDGVYLRKRPTRQIRYFSSWLPDK